MNQLQRDLALFRSFNGSFALESIWQQFCSNPPKGFEKYYKSGGGAAGKKGESQDDAKAADNPKPEVSDPPPPPSRSSSESKPKTSTNSDWNFGMFGQTGSNKSSGSSGTPIGGEGNDKEKWLLIGALSVVALIGGLAFMEMGYKEIGWKEFVNRLVAQVAYIRTTNQCKIAVTWLEESLKNWKSSTRNGCESD